MWQTVKNQGRGKDYNMKHISIAPLDYLCANGVGFEIKPVNSHTVSVKVTCGEKYRIQEFDLNSFHFDTDYDKRVSQVIESIMDSMTDYVLGIEL